MTIQVGNHRLYDNTRLSEYKRCPRRYYYRHVLNWVPDGRTPPALVFGSAWHAGMDVLWAAYSKGFPPEVIVDTAMEAFKEIWSENGYPTEDDTFGTSFEELEPRTPMNAFQMFFHYLEHRRTLLDKCELISVERPFIVPLSPDLSTLYIGKLDKIVRFEGSINAIEHKTTSSYRKASGVNPAYLDSFSPNSQVDGYIHALKMLYGSEAKAIYADVALVHKHVHDAFALQPIRKQTAAVGEWLDDTKYWINRIDTSEAENLWPKNTNSCYDFNSQCPYADLCRGFNIQNLQSRITDGEVLPGFKVEQWDPVAELRINVEHLDQYLTANEK